MNHYRNVNKINVVGKHPPDPARSFDDFAIEESIKNNLKSSGYIEPTAVQKQAVPIMLEVIFYFVTKIFVINVNCRDVTYWRVHLQARGKQLLFLFQSFMI